MELIDVEYDGRTFYAYLNWVDPQKCFDELEFQRIRNEKHVKDIRENFSLLFFGAAVLAENEDGTYTILDSGHRCEAARDLGQDKIPALILVGLDIVDRSLVFHELNDKRKGLKPVDKYKSRLVHKDPTALEIERILKIHGLSVNSKTKGKGIGAVQTLNTIVESYGGDTLDWVLGVLTNSYVYPKFDGGVLEALANIFYTNRMGPNKVNSDRMIKVLIANRSETDIRNASGITKGAGQNSKIVLLDRYIVDEYNRMHIKGPNAATRRLKYSSFTNTKGHK